MRRGGGGGYHSETGRKLWNLFTLREVGNDVRLSRLDEGLNYNGGRCKYIQIKKERIRPLMIERRE